MIILSDDISLNIWMIICYIVNPLVWLPYVYKYSTSPWQATLSALRYLIFRRKRYTNISLKEYRRITGGLMYMLGKNPNIDQLPFNAAPIKSIEHDVDKGITRFVENETLVVNNCNFSALTKTYTDSIQFRLGAQDFINYLSTNQKILEYEVEISKWTTPILKRIDTLKSIEFKKFRYKSAESTYMYSGTSIAMETKVFYDGDLEETKLLASKTDAGVPYYPFYPEPATIYNILWNSEQLMYELMKARSVGIKEANIIFMNHLLHIKHGIGTTDIKYEHNYNLDFCRFFLEQMSSVPILSSCIIYFNKTGRDLLYDVQTENVEPDYDDMSTVIMRKFFSYYDYDTMLHLMKGIHYHLHRNDKFVLPKIEGKKELFFKEENSSQNEMKNLAARLRREKSDVGKLGYITEVAMTGSDSEDEKGYILTHVIDHHEKLSIYKEPIIDILADLIRKNSRMDELWFNYTMRLIGKDKETVKSINDEWMKLYEAKYCYVKLKILVWKCLNEKDISEFFDAGFKQKYEDLTDLIKSGDRKIFEQLFKDCKGLSKMDWTDLLRLSKGKRHKTLKAFYKVLYGMGDIMMEQLALISRKMIDHTKIAKDVDKDKLKDTYKAMLMRNLKEITNESNFNRAKEYQIKREMGLFEKAKLDVAANRNKYEEEISNLKKVIKEDREWNTICRNNHSKNIQNCLSTNKKLYENRYISLPIDKIVITSDKSSSSISKKAMRNCKLKLMREMCNTLGTESNKGKGVKKYKDTTDPVKLKTYVDNVAPFSMSNYMLSVNKNINEGVVIKRDLGINKALHNELYKAIQQYSKLKGHAAIKFKSDHFEQDCFDQNIMLNPVVGQKNFNIESKLVMKEIGHDFDIIRMMREYYLTF